MRSITFLIISLLLFAPPAFAHYEGELLPDSVAVMEYQMIISMTPKDTLTRNKLGMVYLRQSKLGKAREQFMEILKLDAANFDALDSLGLVSDREGNFREAAGWYGRALKVKAGDAGVRKRYETALGRTRANETGNAKKEEVRH
jgi:Flp pilus assembly protein TadD